MTREEGGKHRDRVAIPSREQASSADTSGPVGVVGRQAVADGLIRHPEVDDGHEPEADTPPRGAFGREAQGPGGRGGAELPEQSTTMAAIPTRPAIGVRARLGIVGAEKDGAVWWFWAAFRATRNWWPKFRHCDAVATQPDIEQFDQDDEAEEGDGEPGHPGDPELRGPTRSRRVGRTWAPTGGARWAEVGWAAGGA